MGSSSKGGSQEAPVPLTPPPDPMAQIGPMMAMMAAMASSSGPETPEIPELPEAYKPAFRNWEDERNKLKTNIALDESRTPRNGPGSTVLTSLLDQPTDEDSNNLKAKLG